jgi:hypothetical protein
VSSEGCNPVHTHPSGAFVFLQIESTNTYRNVNGYDSAEKSDGADPSLRCANGQECAVRYWNDFVLILSEEGF